MLKFKHLLVIIIFLSWTYEVQAQTDRKVAVLDMTNYNSETGSSRRLSAIRLLRLIGVPHDVTTSLNIALSYPIVITSSRILDNAFSASDITEIENYVNNGGVLLTSSMRDPDLYNLFGISDIESVDTVYEISWNTPALPVFDLIDDTMETTISIGRFDNLPTFVTRSYVLSTASSLADYNNGECAVAFNNYGAGRTYCFGPDFRDILNRNQMNFDFNAHRSYSNGFEPSSDVVMMVIRNIIRQHIPHTVYKHTAPWNHSAVMMLTHDVDSRTAMDTMQDFITWEETEGISAQYNITTRYLNDNWMTNFYVGTWSQVHQILEHGHVIASHSVGHFPDFDDETKFPLGTIGNDPGNYTPLYISGNTTGGSVYGELEVSQVLLEDDHSIKVRSFRAGHLAYNDSLILGLMGLGYDFNSTYSSNDVLSNFPYYAMETRSFSSEESTILEIPMTISDVFNSDPITEFNYQDKVDIWVDVTNRYNNNHSNVVLLIHPNRQYKLIAQQDYVTQLPSNMVAYGFEAFGDFWRKRDSLQFHTELGIDTLKVVIQDDLLLPEQSFIIDWDGSLDTVIFENQLGEAIDFIYEDWDAGQRIYFQEDLSIGIEEKQDPLDLISVYPNPTNGNLKVLIPESVKNGTLSIYDLTGRLVYQTELTSQYFEIDLSEWVDDAGTYLLNFTTGNQSYTKKVQYYH